ncbi:PH domain-containing protein [Leifsonia poae]|uniref:PH domain-containing protein n=1 Tax=Leifsonia poae TaxID=110933 RepID=UPI001CBE95B9|nr:PH domain-containing protein [Leifsonia poae]
MAEPGTRVVFVSTFNRALAVVVWLLDAFALMSYAMLHAGLPQPLVLLPVALVALAAWTALWRPRLVVDDEGTELRNVFRTVFVPWAALIQVDTRHSLMLYTPGHKYSAWVAPAPGRTAASRAARAERRGRVGPAPTRDDGTVRPGDLLGTDSGQAAYLVRDRWSELRDSGRIEAGVADSTPVRIRIHLWLSAALLVLLVASSFVLFG